MVPYTELKSPPPPGGSAIQELDRKAEYLDLDGVPRRSSHVTHRMVQRGVPLGKAISFTLDERTHMSEEIRKQDALGYGANAQQFTEENVGKPQANAALKLKSKTQKERWKEEAVVHTKERITPWYKLQQSQGQIQESIVVVTERGSTQCPWQTDTYVDAEGNFRRKSSTAVVPSPWGSQEAANVFFPAPTTPPAPEKMFTPKEHV